MQRGDTITATGTARPDIDDAFWTIVTGDDQWVRAEFDAIVDANWDTPAPPPPPAPPQPDEPRRQPAPPIPDRPVPCHSAPARPGRPDQRSPPATFSG
jgi:hypothetical protein